MRALCRRRVLEELERRTLLAASVAQLSGPFLGSSILEIPADALSSGDSLSARERNVPSDPPPSDPLVTIQANTHLTILPTFDSSITSDPNAATIMATINEAIFNYQAWYSDPITVRIKFQKTNSGLATVNWWYYNTTYSFVRSALSDDATTIYDQVALFNLPSTANNPVNGSASMSIKHANVLALGTDPGATPDGFDGTVSVNTSICNLTRPPGDPGKYDLLALVEHEINEILGMSSALDGLPNPLPQDLYRYNSSGGRSYSAGAESYFSINAVDLWAQQNQTVGGEYGDWFTGATAPQVQDAFATPGAAPNLGIEVLALDVIGWNLAPLMVWTGQGDGVNWTDPANWATNSVPTAADNVYIATADDPTIQIVSGTQTIDSIISFEALTIAGGNLSIASASQIDSVVTLNSGTITGAGNLTINHNINWAGGTMAGTGRTIISSIATMNITGTGARSSPRTLQVDGQVMVAPGGSLVPILGSLTVGPSGRIGLTDNSMIIDYTGASPVSTIGGYVTTGYAGGAWNGVGINSSVAASTPGTAVGFGEATDIFSSFPASFAGQTVDNTSVLLRYTLLGDATLDRTTDTLDFNILVANFSKTSRRWSQADFNFNQTTDTVDFNLLTGKFSQSLPAPLFGSKTIRSALTDLI